MTKWIAVGALAALAGCSSESMDGSGGGTDVLWMPGATAGAGGTSGAQAGEPGPGGSPSLPTPIGSAGTGSVVEPPPGAPPTTPSAPGAPIPADCQGFPLEGILYSPGGNVLPNICEPFHPTWNNPYAVLCVHAWPWYDTGYPGDEYCILPPTPGEGIQVGFHPQELDYWAQVSAGDMSGYASPDDVWRLAPGGEITRNYLAPVDEPANNYYRTYFRMRTGSHHNIVTMHTYEPTPHWTNSGSPGLFGGGAGALMGVLGGQQRPDDSTPVTLEKPPEDEGLYLVWPASPSVLFNIHFFNVTQGDTLKEGWSNIWWEDDTRTAVSWYMGLPPLQIATLSVTPGETVDLHYSWDVLSDVRLLRVFGHRHAWTTNFSSWIERAGGGGNEIVYQSYDWFDMPTYRYDSVVQNPPVDTVGRTDGAPSGVIDMHAGDKLHFNCHIEYTDERAAAVTSPMTPSQIGTLGFANEVYTGEMCIQFGNSVGILTLPADNLNPAPDFAK